MSETPEYAEPSFSERHQLGNMLSEEAKRLQGIRQQHFVDQPSLCNSCKFSTILRQASQNTRKILCGVLGGTIVPEDVAECSAYETINSLSLRQMADIAVLIDDRPDRYKGYL